MLCLEQAEDPEAAEKLRHAVYDLMHRAPLFGLTVLGAAIRVVEAKGRTDTMCTDGRTIWYSPQWVMRKPLPSIMFDVLHETLHVFHNHPARRGERVWKVWGYAVDVRVAHDALAIVRARGPWELDRDHIPAHAWAETLTAEQIYDQLMEDEATLPEDYEPDIQPPPDATKEDDEEFRQTLTSDLAHAAIAEDRLGAGGVQKYGDAVWKRLEELRRCDVPWDVLLTGRLCGAFGHDVATWSPPNRRWFPEIPLPSRRATRLSTLLLGIDVSGSITGEHIARFKAAITPAARRAQTTTVITFDEVIREQVTVRNAEALLAALQFSTGSHSSTDVRPLFEEAEKLKCAAIAILTDGHIILPEKSWPETHWVLTPSGRELPWGRNYRLQYSW